MDQTSTPAPPPRRPGSPGVHRLGLTVAALAAVATFAGAAAITGGVAPAPASAAASTTLTADSFGTASPVRTEVRTVYVPAPQPTAAQEPPVKVIVINKPSGGEDEDEGGDD